MKAWIIVVIVFLMILFLIIFSGSAYMVDQNIKSSVTNRFIPFSASMGPEAEDVYITMTNENGDKTSQLQCPAGYNINIVGAFSQVFDPNNECTTSSSNSISQALSATCGATGNPQKDPQPVPISSCASDGDCYNPNIFQCVNSKCQLRENACQADSDCGGSGVYKCLNGLCIDKNICLGITYDGKDELQSPLTLTGNSNPICDPSNKNTRCAVRDASAYVAQKCDGQNQCQLKISDFGPLPCSGFNLTSCGFSSSQTNQQDYTSNRDTSYCQLPLGYGASGGIPEGSSANGQSFPATVNLGYQVHGFYTCIPQ
jgi:hypothetical protein